MLGEKLIYFFVSFMLPQGRTHPAEDKGGPDPRGVAVVRQHQVRHVRDRGVPAVRSGLRLGALVPLPQPAQVLVGSAQPHRAHQVRGRKTQRQGNQRRKCAFYHQSESKVALHELILLCFV